MSKDYKCKNCGFEGGNEQRKEVAEAAIRRLITQAEERGFKQGLRLASASSDAYLEALTLTTEAYLEARENLKGEQK